MLQIEPQLTADDSGRTVRRVQKLKTYFEKGVLRGSELVCPHGGACKASHPGEFFAGQLHHVGEHYDLAQGSMELRILVVGQEYGHGPEYVTLEKRHIQIKESATDYNFRRTSEREGRNPHMKGCTSLLRLIFGKGLGADYSSEFVTIGTQQVHVFECFALVNFLLCSAVPANKSKTTPQTPPSHARGKTGRSTRIMRSNCSPHFREAIEVLQPTLMIAQGIGVRKWIRNAYPNLAPTPPPDTIETLNYVNGTCTLVSFCHPSARGKQAWGRNEPTAYLLETVAPTIKKIMAGYRNPPAARDQ